MGFQNGLKRLGYWLGWNRNGVPQSTDSRDSSEIQNIAAMVNYNVATNVSTHATPFDWVNSNLRDMAINTPSYLPQPKSDTPAKRAEGIINVRDVIYEQRSR